MTKLGSELIFISVIKRDGSGTVPVDPEYVKNLQKYRFEINCLSITNGTYIASDFNSFVVRLKKP